MDHPRKHQVSLRGASAKEITRDALLEKVSQERELRNYTRRANAAALFIQRVWRRYIDARTAALQFRDEWESLMKESHGLVSGTWISSHLLRPFLFFTMCLSTKHRRMQDRDLACMQHCFKILLESIDSADPGRNFCSLAVGTHEERKSWTYQTRKLVSLCSCILAACDNNSSTHDIIGLTSLAMRLLISLSDLKGWKMVTDANVHDADIAVKGLVCFMGRSDLYLSIRKYIMKLDAPLPEQRNNIVHTDVKFLITASTITLALRPFHVLHHEESDASSLDSHCAPWQFCLFLLTIPWLVQQLPAVLLPAIKHKSVLLPCFETLLIMKGELSTEISKMDLPGCSHWAKEIPSVGWVLANIICLVKGKENGSLDIKLFSQGLDYALYVRVVIILAENLLNWLEHLGSIAKENHGCEDNIGTSAGHERIFTEEETTSELLMSYMDQFRPICQQSHLMELLAIAKTNRAYDKAVSGPSNTVEDFKVLELVDVVYFYSCLLRVFSVLNPVGGSFPVLNMLAFTPGFLASLGVLLENKLFNGNAPDINSKNIYSREEWHMTFEENHKHEGKGGGSKWASIVHKITKKSPAGLDKHVGSTDGNSNTSLVDDAPDIWDVRVLRCGPQQLSKDIRCLLHLFCATYSHLLLVLDDIEFYEKQVPFKLEQQRRITSVLNTLVYNGQSRNSNLQIKSLMDAATKCLHLLYERDCRHQFCPPALWLSPARKNRPPIAIAARTHEVLHAKSDDALMISSTESVITTMPHVYPFEERVEMFRELIKMDKVSRTVAGEVSGPGSQNVEIVVRRGHIVEDGFQQLNSLGSRLKSSIRVSFVSECGLPEAGLDYGGLSKEFLTDLSKLAFSPEYGLFSQTSTEDRLLIPNTSAKYLENGLHMIEFLGRVVGKALYEGILLDYAFSHVFVQKLLGRYSFLDELSAVDPELYRNLMYVKHYEGDVKELSLDFTVTEESFGKRHVIELRPGGKDAYVTNENKMQYIHAIADYKLNRQILPFANAFYRGLTDLISPYWLKLFNASEFNQLLSGGNHDIDIDDLKSNTRYTGGYTEGSRTVKIFWEVMKGFEPKERCLLLKFVTSCSRPPLLGFKYLHPTFTIHKVSCDVPLWATIGGQDVDRLPSASTCYNTLKLPTYKRPSTLRAKLLYAISSNAGFELS